MATAPEMCSSCQYWTNQWSTSLLRQRLSSLLARSNRFQLSDHRGDPLLLCYYTRFILPNKGGSSRLFPVIHRLRCYATTPPVACSNPHVEWANSPYRGSILLGNLTKNDLPPTSTEASALIKPILSPAAGKAETSCTIYYCNQCHSKPPLSNKSTFFIYFFTPFLFKSDGRLI